MNPFLQEIEKGMGRPMTPNEALAAVAALYLKQRDELLAACKEARDALIVATETSDSFCNFCNGEAPKYATGEIIGPIDHDPVCVFAIINAAISAVDGE